MPKDYSDLSLSVRKVMKNRVVIDIVGTSDACASSVPTIKNPTNTRPPRCQPTTQRRVQSFVQFGETNHAILVLEVLDVVPRGEPVIDSLPVPGDSIKPPKPRPRR